MKVNSEISVLEQFLAKTQIFVFRVAILVKIQPIFNQIGALIKKITSDSSFLWLKTLKSTISSSGFPKKVCQGCHIF